MQIEARHHPRYLAALLAWQAEMGADECIGDAGVDRYAEVPSPPAARRAAAALAAAASPAPALPEADPVGAARAAAAAAGTLADLAAAQAAYDHCPLRQGARSFVFADGLPGARVMVIGEAPGRDEDLAGRPFVGRAGQLLDRMFAAIGLARDAAAPDAALYITNVLPWRPPGNRDPEPGEIAMMLPFLERHVGLAAPEVLVVMGNTPAAAVLGARGITRLRGRWTEAMGRPVLPMLHPAYLLRQPAMKRETWADLLALQAWLRGERG
ncbi:MAG: uracil-DNA glycosylase [Gemmobacter sp.]